jgi:hypothetical protein
MARKLIDILSPRTIGAENISIQLDPSSEPLLTYKPVTLMIDYSACLPAGISLPLELIVQPAKTNSLNSGFISALFRRSAPSSYTFIPQTAGQHLIRLREIAHNRYQGRLTIVVGGDEFNRIEIGDRI